MAVSCLPADCITSTTTSEGTTVVGYSWIPLFTPFLTVVIQLWFHVLRRPLAAAVIEEPLAVTIRHARRVVESRQRDIREVRRGGHVA